MNPLILATPSPDGLSSVMSTSYSFPSSTGEFPPSLPRLLLAFFGVLFFGLIRHSHLAYSSVKVNKPLKFLALMKFRKSLDEQHCTSKVTGPVGL